MGTGSVGAPRCPRCGVAMAAGTAAGSLGGVCAACLAGSVLEEESPPYVTRRDAPQAGHPPKRLGGHQLIHEIARGGMGVVYLARQMALGRTIALKLLPAGLVTDPARLARFRAEAALASRLRHPNIVAIHEVGEDAGVPFFSMEYVEGRDLGRLVRERLPSPRQAAMLVRGVARAIEYAHARGVLHRDLKPSNVLVTPEGEPRVTDFGLAKTMDPGCELTLSGEILGSPSFMAPEQAEGRKSDVDVRTDVYGLGGLLYWALTGRPPFVADSVSATLQRVVEGGPIPPAVLQPGVPPDLQTIALRCLARDRKHRYATAGAVADELERFLRGQPIHARPPFPVERLWRWARREPTLAGLMATAAVLGAVLVGGALFIAGQRESARQRDAMRRAEAERNRYVSDLGAASRALSDGDVHATLQMLGGLAPRPGEPDPRGFEWHWLHARAAESPHELWWSGPDPVQGFAWSSDGRRLALLDEKGVRVVSAGGRKLFARHPLVVPGARRGAAFGSDGRYLYLADALGLRRMELTVGRVEAFLSEPLDGVEASPDGRRLAVRTAAGGTRRESQDVMLVDADSGEVRETLEGAGGPALAWMPDGGLLGVAWDGRIWSWDERSGRRERGGAAGNPPASAAIAPDGLRCAVLWADGMLRVRDARDGRVLSERQGRPQRDVRLAFSPDGRQLASAGGSDERVTVQSVDDGAVLHRWTAHTDQVTALAWRRDGSALVSAGRDGTVRAWDTTEASRAPSWEHRCGPLPSLACQFSPDGRWVAGLRRNDSGEESALWSVSDPEARPITFPGRPVGFSPDGRFLLQWEPGGNLRLWDVTNGTEAVSFRVNGHPSETPDQLSPDGRILVSLDTRSRVRVVHAATAEELPGPVARVHRVAISPDGEWLGFATAGTVGVFRVGGDDQRARECAGATDLAFSPDSRFLAVGRASGRVLVLDVATAKPVAELPGHTAAVTALQFLPDGRSLVTAGEDSVVRWWHVPAWRALVQMTQPSIPRQLRCSPDGTRLLLGLRQEYRVLSDGRPVPPAAPVAPAGFWSDPVGIGLRLSRREGTADAGVGR